MTQAIQTKLDSNSSAADVLSGRNLAGKTIIVTGANTGIGEATASALAGAGAHVVFACRREDTAQAALARTRAAHSQAKAEFVELDLASFSSIRKFADVLAADKIDALVCNAGLSVNTWIPTQEGFEATVGVSHIGHFLLTRLLMPRLLAAGAARVVMVSSLSHRMPAKLDFDKFPMTAGNFNGLAAYGQAKLCNVLMAKSLQQRYGDRGLTACALHPGTLVTTEIGRNSKIVSLLIKLVSPFTKSPAQGAATSVYGVVHEPASDIAGKYLKDCHVEPCSDEANDANVAARLWTLSEGFVARGGEFPAWP